MSIEGVHQGMMIDGSSLFYSALPEFTFENIRQHARHPNSATYQRGNSVHDIWYILNRSKQHVFYIPCFFAFTTRPYSSPATRCNPSQLTFKQKNVTHYNSVDRLNPYLAMNASCSLGPRDPYG